tara:strand:- start:166 stop:357 length:192 start_codon:yes stop_codon:yes gene_type:complete
MKLHGSPTWRPFEYGKYIIVYREVDSKLLRFHKEHIDNYRDAKKIRDELLSAGVDSPVIKKVG